MVNLVAMGVDPKKVLIGDNGQIFEFDKDGGRKGVTSYSYSLKRP